MYGWGGGDSSRSRTEPKRPWIKKLLGSDLLFSYLPFLTDWGNGLATLARVFSTSSLLEAFSRKPGPNRSVPLSPYSSEPRLLSLGFTLAQTVLRRSMMMECEALPSRTRALWIRSRIFSGETLASLFKRSAHRQLNPATVFAYYKGPSLYQSGGSSLCFSAVPQCHQPVSE